MKRLLIVILLLGMGIGLLGCSTSCGTGGGPVTYPQPPVNPLERNNPAAPRI